VAARDDGSLLTLLVFSPNPERNIP
jgi:hypothetical protein